MEQRHDRGAQRRRQAGCATPGRPGSADHRRHRGIGAATVRRFVGEGAWVVASGRSPERGAGLARELGERVRFIAADVTDEGQLDTLIDQAAAWRGRLDVLFNNAGETQVPGSLLALEPAPLRAEVDTLFSSVALATRKAALVMREHGGVILNCGSTAAHRAGSQSAVYSALKAAVCHFTRCAALELAESRIRVNAISPGAIVTPIFLKAAPIPAGRESDALDALREVFGSALPVAARGNPRMSRRWRLSSQATTAAMSPGRTGSWTAASPPVCRRRRSASRRR